jgi:hypothetical protein
LLPRRGVQPGFGLLMLVSIRPFDQALHGLGRDGRAAAQMKVEVEQDGPQRKYLGEYRRVTSRWLRRLQQRGTDPFTYRLIAGERLNARTPQA